MSRNEKGGNAVRATRKQPLGLASERRIETGLPEGNSIGTTLRLSMIVEDMPLNGD